MEMMMLDFKLNLEQKMSEQEFKGLSPKSETGKSIYFFSLDNWIDLHDCIDMLITPGLPAYPMMEAEEAEYLADEMQKRLDFGIIRAYYELQAKQIFRTSHISNENESNTIPNTIVDPDFRTMN
jgi:hypothetical protein